MVSNNSVTTRVIGMTRISAFTEGIVSKIYSLGRWQI